MPRRSRRGHVPTEEEDNRVFLATGYRYLPAFERGFPYPWCAKRSSKGWRVRDIPPDSSKPGVEFAGFRTAEKMLRSREILLQRIQNKEGQQPGLCSTNDESTVNADQGGPLKKRKISAAGKGAPIAPGDQKAVDDWFRQTPQAVKAQVTKLKEEQFQSFLTKKKVQIKQEMKEREKKIKKEMRERERKIKQELREKELREREAKKQNKTVDFKGKDKLEEPPSSPAGITQPPIANALPVSPIRRKHKKGTPKRNQQSHNSITLGEDPEMDQMIEDIVLECTSGFGKGKELHNNSNKPALEFDGSAVSALREAALTMMTHTNDDDVGKQELDTKITSTSATETTEDVENQSNAAGEIGTANIDAAIEDSSDATSGTDKQITSMIQQLIVEAEQDSGCHFDGRAIEALKEAAKDIITNE